MEEEIPQFSSPDDFKFMTDITIDGESYFKLFGWFYWYIFFTEILTHCENDLLNSDLFSDETMAQLNEPLPLDLMNDVKCNMYMEPNLSPPNMNFESSASPGKVSYPKLQPVNNNIPSPAFSPIHSQSISSSPVVQNLQVKNVPLPVQNPTAVIISSSNLQHNTQPLVYTSLPVENQHIILQQSNSKIHSNNQKNAPVILQNIQQPVLLQAKILKSDSQVCLIYCM